MESVIFTIPIALGIGIIFLVAFYWAWKSGQFDNVEGPAERMLHDDNDPMEH